MKKILILEGKNGYAKELEEYFSRCAGIEIVRVTEDADEILSLIGGEESAVVVMDLSSSVAGLVVVEKAKALGREADFVILGNGMGDEADRAIVLGAKYYFLNSTPAAHVGLRVAFLCANNAAEQESVIKAED